MPKFSYLSFGRGDVHRARNAFSEYLRAWLKQKCQNLKYPLQTYTTLQNYFEDPTSISSQLTCLKFGKHHKNIIVTVTHPNQLLSKAVPYAKTFAHARKCHFREGAIKPSSKYSTKRYSSQWDFVHGTNFDKGCRATLSCVSPWQVFWGWQAAQNRFPPSNHC